MDETKLRVYYEMGAIAGGVKIENDKIIVSDLIKPVPMEKVEVKPVAVKESEKKTEVNETKVENPLDDKVASVEISKVTKQKAETTKTIKDKK